MCHSSFLSFIVLSRVLLLDWLLPSPLTSQADGSACLWSLANYSPKILPPQRGSSPLDLTVPKLLFLLQWLSKWFMASFGL